MPSQCKSCNQVVDDAALRPVGDSFFCQTCFSALMDAPPASPPPPQLASLKVEKEKAAKCFICKTALKGTPYKSMGKIAFCEECVGDLTSFKAPESVHEPQRRIAPKPEPEAEPYYSRATHRESGATFGEFGEKRCSQCQRRVLEPNGYEVHGDAVWCPICIRENPAPAELTPNSEQGRVAETAPPPPTATPVAPPKPASGAQPDGASTWLACDSCGKSLPTAQFSLIEGFRICPPCEETDREAALHLARARHRKEMIALLEDLGQK